MSLEVISYRPIASLLQDLFVIPYSLKDGSPVSHLETANGFHLP